MKGILVPIACLVLASCANTGENDSRKISRTFIKDYVTAYGNPPKRVLFNDHPAADIEVTYDLIPPDSPRTRHTVTVKAFKEVPIGSAASGSEVIETEFTEPSRRSR